MAKKKTKKTIETAEVVEETIQAAKPEKAPISANIIAEGTQNIGYLGKVSVKIQHGNKTISSRTFHNSGMPTLFKFLCNALAGNYVETLRPCKIKLFYYDAAEGISAVAPSEFNWTNAFAGSNPPIGVTPYIVYDTIPQLRKKADDATTGVDSYHYETTFHFRVPFSYISRNIIHMVGFYPNNTIDPGEASAYYLFTDTNTSGTVIWSPIEIPEDIGNFSIIIDWTMSVMNKTATKK